MAKDRMSAPETAGPGKPSSSPATRPISENKGEPQGGIDKLLRQDDYLMMAPHLTSLAKGAGVSDGGCGLGGRVLSLNRQGLHTAWCDAFYHDADGQSAPSPACQRQAGSERSPLVKIISVMAHSRRAAEEP
ncbi:MAG: hypothetical protein VW124_13305 [Paracoccaceae bacterium]